MLLHFTSWQSLLAAKLLVRAVNDLVGTSAGVLLQRRQNIDERDGDHCTEMKKKLKSAHTTIYTCNLACIRTRNSAHVLNKSMAIYIHALKFSLYKHPRLQKPAM